MANTRRAILDFLQEKKLFKSDILITFFSSLLTLLLAFSGLLTVKDDKVQEAKIKLETINNINVKRQQMLFSQKLLAQQNYLDTLRSILCNQNTNKTLIRSNLETSLLNARISTFDSSLIKLNKRFEKIELIITQSPEEVLELPLLKRDLETIKLSNDVRFENLNKDLDRAYNIIYTSLAALAIAIISPILSSIFGIRKNTE